METIIPAGQPCPFCSAPATNDSVDLVELETENGKRDFLRYVSDIRYGCEKHPAFSICYNLDGSVAMTPPPGYEFVTGPSRSLFGRGKWKSALSVLAVKRNG